MQSWYSTPVTQFSLHERTECGMISVIIPHLSQSCNTLFMFLRHNCPHAPSPEKTVHDGSENHHAPILYSFIIRSTPLSICSAWSLRRLPYEFHLRKPGLNPSWLRPGAVYGERISQRRLSQPLPSRLTIRSYLSSAMVQSSRLSMSWTSDSGNSTGRE